ncbi:MAG: FAD-binding oxidoreductase, partial [Kiloniellales bacterium]|nr:FAD-binding oxidoreductase [Kiloniellales bacterium]
MTNKERPWGERGMAQQDVVVIGAGIVGVSSALWLQRDGHGVTLVDPLGPGQATSYGNGGLVAVASIVPVTTPGLIWKAPKLLIDPMGPLYLKWGYLPKLLPWLIPYLRQASDKKCRAIAASLAGLLGDAVEQHQALASGTPAEQWLVPSDYLWAYKNRDAYEADAYAWGIRQSHGVNWELLDRPGLRDYDPNLGESVGFAVRVPNHATITDPGRYVAALADELQSRGGRLLRDRVTDFTVANDRITGVRTESEELACERVVVAAGPWSARLMKKLGLKMPLEAERGYHIEFENPEVMP